MSETVTSDNTVKSVETTLTIIEGLKELEVAGITELSEFLGISKSTIHRHILTLERNGYIVRENDRFSLSYRFLDLGGFVQSRNEMFEIIKPKVEHLANQTAERAMFITKEYEDAVVVYVVSGDQAVTTGIRTGTRMPLHCTACGKAILAHLPTEEIEEIIQRCGLTSRTEQTITERDELFHVLEMTRERNYAFDMGEYIEGLRCVGAPVLGTEGSVIGSLSIAGPARRMQGEWFEEEIPNMLLGTVNELELKLTYEV